MTPSPLDAIVHSAARKLLNLRMTKINGPGDKHDADNLIADLDVLAEIFDGVILELGLFAKEALGLSSEQIKRDFTDQLRNALEGNATFSLEEAGQRAQAHLQAAE